MWAGVATTPSKTGGLISRGLARLFERDLQRESAVEAASFLTGYLLGLPCCAYTPTAFKPLEMLALAGDAIEENLGGSRLQARLVDRLLIWLVAPAALESQLYEEMLLAQPTLAAQFLASVRRRRVGSQLVGLDVNQGGWSAEDDEGRLRWAYAEAKKLLRKYSGVREELQEQMVAGVSAGDCVALLEKNLKCSLQAV